MDFLEAAEIAKRSPGARITRDDTGLFVVYLNDGRVITSPEQQSSAPTSAVVPQRSIREEAQRDRELKDTVAALHRQIELGDSEVRELKREIDNLIAFVHRRIDRTEAEIRELKHEVNNLKDMLSNIPDSEWERFAEEKDRLDLQGNAEERDRIVGLARAGKLSHEQLQRVADNASRLGIPDEDIEFIQAEIIRTRPRRPSPESLVVHATTDGQ